MWKKLRIFILLFILFLVAADTYLTKYRAVSWDETLWVAVYPINNTNDPNIERYIAGLSDRNFQSIENFFQREATDYGISISKPFKIMLAHEVHEQPPVPPQQDSNMLQVGWWSLKLRYWAYTHDHSDFAPHIKVFVIYHPYVQESKLSHSLGMEKGMIGVVHAYAHREMEGKNNLVIAHEMLHTIGATDKYDLQSGQPIFPDGYAEPDKSPRYPQRFTELMGGRTPLSKSESVMPRSLRSARVGLKTAEEINWIEAK
jgi:hypothetical protein